METTYNGWTNLEHFLLSQRLYALTTAVENYQEFVEAIYGAEQRTQDGVDYCDPTVNVHELNEMIWDL